jgi:hypothetical protein
MNRSKAMVYRVAYRFHVLNARQRLQHGVPVGQVVDDFLMAMQSLSEFCVATDDLYVENPVGETQPRTKTTLE